MATGQINLADSTALQAKLEEIDNKVDNSRVLTDVPLGAKFTDTEYDDAAVVQALTTATTKLATIEDGATADQTGAEIEALLDVELGSTTWKTGGGSYDDTAILSSINDIDERVTTIEINGVDGGSVGFIDGGNASSVYTEQQLISGGTA